jgi:outer membrane protein
MRTGLQLLLMLLIASPNLQAQSDGSDLTLEKCVEIAVQNATSVRRAEAGAEISAVDILRAYGNFMPNLNFSAGAADSVGKGINTVLPVVVSTSNYGLNYELSSSVNIFNGYADKASLNAALARAEAAQLNIKEAKLQIAFDVTQAYLQAVLNGMIVKIAKRNLQLSQARQAQFIEESKAGARRKPDLLSQKAQVSADEAFLFKAEAGQKKAEISLVERIKLDPNQDYRLQEPDIHTMAAKAIESEKDLIRSAIASRPDLRASERVADASGFGITEARSDLFPKINFGLSALDTAYSFHFLTYDGVNQVPANQPELLTQASDQIMYTVGLSLTWNIFDRSETKSKMQKSRVAADLAHLENEDLRIRVVSEVRKIYTEYQSGVKQQVAAENGLAAAQAAYEMIAQQFQVGALKFIDLQNAQAMLVQAQVARAQAIVESALQIRAIALATGAG